VADYAKVTYPTGDQAERRFGRIIGNSAALESVLDQVEQVAPTDSTVLVEGETGTGKELIAHAIHNASQRFGRPLIKLNCAAIPLDLLESELFGHEKGAFTGAIAQKIGRFEMADKGTLFLDEVGDIPPALQPKLLRVRRRNRRCCSGAPTVRSPTTSYSQCASGIYLVHTSVRRSRICE
jgi:transcriptional regulator with GAF, ATPase, and Fis domain